LLAGRMLELIQMFYDEPRIIRITKTDDRGRPIAEDVPINQPAQPGQPSDSGVLNDLTLGEYDVVVTEQPLQVTFQNSQFIQCMELLEKGAPIPWPFVMRYTNLTHKQEMIDAIEAQGNSDPMMDAKIALVKAQTDKTQNQSVKEAVSSLYSAMQAAGVIAATPATSPLADTLLKSAGFQDKDAAPIVPAYDGMAEAAPTTEFAPTNYDPSTPASAGTGLSEGIRTPEIDGVPA